MKTKKKLSKKDLEALVDGLIDRDKRREDELSKIRYKLDALCKGHREQTVATPWGQVKLSHYNHREEKVETERAGTITLSDLASLVIDGKPIEVTEVVEQTKKILPSCGSLSDLEQN